MKDLSNYTLPAGAAIQYQGIAFVLATPAVVLAEHKLAAPAFYPPYGTRTDAKPKRK